MSPEMSASPRRWPDAKKLSVAILENLVKPIIGEDGIAITKQPLVDKEQREKLAEVLLLTEKRFLAEYDLPEICGLLLDLPLATLPSVQKAVWDFCLRPASPDLCNLLIVELGRYASSLPAGQIERAVNAYMGILKRELLSLDSVRENQQALATLNIEDNTANIARGIYLVVDGINELKTFLAQQSPDRGRAAIQNALHQLPSPPSDFKGRKKELRQLLNDVQTNGVVISGLYGTGGIGKTALALVLAQQLADHYPDAQFYLDLKGAPGQTALKPEEIMTHVLHGFEPLAKLPDNPDELRGLYCSALAGKHVLLLLDNARGRPQVEPLLPPSGCLLLVTSRQRFDLPGLAVLNLERLPEADAVKLLRAIAPRIGDQAGALAQRCGCLPLALRVVGSLLKLHPALAVEDVLHHLEAGKQKLDEVDASLSLSYDGLAAELQRAWRLLAVFPGSFDLPAAAPVWDLEADTAQERISALWDYSLVEYDEKSRRYALHDLARRFTAARLESKEHAAAQARHAQHYLQILGSADQLYLQGGPQIAQGLKLYDGEQENITAGQAWASAKAAQDNTAARLACAYPDAGAYVLNLRLHPRQQIVWLQSGLEAARLLGDRQFEGIHLGNLGLAYKDLGEPRRAIEYNQQQLVIKREIGDRRGEGNAMGSLGLAYARLGEPRRAIEYYDQWLVITREIGDRRGEGQALGNLGNAYADLGEPRRAIEDHEKALVIFRGIGDRLGEGATLGNLGLAYAALGDPRRAIDYYDQQLVITREIGDRRGEGSALGNMGTAYKNLGELQRAIEYYEQHLVITREIGDRRGEGSASWNLGLIYEQQGELAQAVECMQVRVDYQRAIGHPDAEKHAAYVEQIRQRMKGD